MHDLSFPFSEIEDLANFLNQPQEPIAFDLFSNLKFVLDSTPNSREIVYNNSDLFDENFQSEVTESTDQCEYYDGESFRNLNFDKRVSFLFCNLRSFPSNFENFYLNYFHNNPSKPSILAFCETRITDDTQDLFSIPGYNSIHNNRNSRGGGLMLALSSNFSFCLIPECTFMLEFIESLFVKVEIGNQTIILGVIYRPPAASKPLFLEYYNKILEHINYDKCYILGDFNLDLLKYETDNHVRSYVDLSMEFSYRPLINKPTRITSHSATLLDHIWSNNLSETLNSGILMNDCSDHFAPFCSVQEISNSSSNNENSIKYRDWKPIDSDEFFQYISNELEHFNSLQLDSTSDIDSSLLQLTNILKNSVEVFCPEKTLSQPHDKKFCPWFSDEIKSLIKEKNKLYRKYVKRPITFGEQYRMLRNRLNNLIKSKKKSYYKNLLVKYNNNLRKYWSVLNELLKRKKNNSCEKLKINGNTTEDKNEIVNEFGNYFSNITTDIVNELPINDINFESYITRNNYESFSLQQTSASEILSIIMNLNDSNSSPDFPTKIVKRCSSLISVHLSNIFNRCIQLGFFPTSFKTAKITPIFKSKSPLLSSNYRPISLLPVLAKIFEKKIYSELTNYVQNNNILCNQQSGFRKNFSTQITITKVLQNIITAIENKETSICIFLDLKKAFDMVDHTILLRKLEIYGVRGLSLSLFSSYLSNRAQYVQVDGYSSDIFPQIRGIPQGSVLSGLLFNLFINDIVNSSNIAKFQLFADDTSLFFNHQLFSTANDELKNIGDWLASNKLSINIEKTVYLLFNSTKIVPPLPELQLYGTPIQRQNNTKFLGILIDDKLSWKNHAHSIIGKISRMLGVIYKIKNNLTLSALRTIYLSLIQPSIHYGIIFWYGVSSDLRIRIFRLQKKAIRLITDSPRLAHSEPLFKKTKILQLEDLFRLETTKFIHRELLFGNNFSFVTHADIHRYPTRSNNNFILPYCRTNTAKDFVLNRGLRFYNFLPEPYKNFDNVGTFKCKFKLDTLNAYVSAA